MRLEMWPINCKFLTLKTLHMVWETCSALKNEFSFSSFRCLSFTFHLKEPRSFSWLTLSLSLTPGCTCGLHIWRQSWFSEHKHTAVWLSSNFHIQRFSKEYIKVNKAAEKKKKTDTNYSKHVYVLTSHPCLNLRVCMCAVEGVAQRPAALLGDGVRRRCWGAAWVGWAGPAGPSDCRSHRPTGEGDVSGISLLRGQTWTRTWTNFFLSS